MLELVLGGARSGKSRHAEHLAATSQYSVHYIATAQAWDDEMQERIDIHRAQRPTSWFLHECPMALAETIQQQAAPDRVLLIDCLTLWLTNHLLADQMSIPQRCNELVEALDGAEGRIIVVSNEVGQGIVPANALSRRFVDEAGRLHQHVAAVAHRVWWVVAGIPQCIKGNSKNDI